ncbi:MAG: transposase [Acidobacteriota bacterium]|nr:transposase [Acidobacteriota bacterium]MDE3043279.1 transposase [Acidobacteriota bacterium]MDE3107457.1 transposase [Acidobacteriota bacterium]MDE3222726.1 transposase [Acidobacteriota bacterium]
MASRPTIPIFSHTGEVLSRAVTFQFALDPNAQQRILFAKCAGARRFTVNHHLARVKVNLDARSAEREVLSESGNPCEPSTPSLSWSGFSFINEFNAWKNGQSVDAPVNEDGSRGLVWRHELPNDVFECASVDAARALENFSASRKGKRSGAPVGFPRFQAKGKVTPSFRLRNRATPGRIPSSQPIRFSDPAHLRLPKFGPVKLFGPTRKVRRMIDAGRFHIYSATLTQRAGRWTVSLTGVAAELHQAGRSRTSRHAVPVGVDRGIISLCVAADANGVLTQSFEGVTTLKQALGKLKAANQALARTTPGSKGRQRARARLAKTHRKVVNTRRHLVHQASRALVDRCQTLVIEDLNVAGMVRNRHLTRSISDAAMGELSRQLLYKARWRGVEVRVAARFFPSSKTCSGCGEVRDDLALSTRSYSCETCGLVIDRDLNAAINLARWRPKESSAVTSLGPTRSALLSIV